jgi:hypothetical protein
MVRFRCTTLGLMLLSAGVAAQTPQYTISTAAGSVALPPAHAPALSTGIGRPVVIAADAAGNIYFAGATFYSVFRSTESRRRTPAPNRLQKTLW